MEPQKLSYTIGEAVRATGLSRSSLYLAIKDERIKSRTVCGRRLILANSLAAFVEGRSVDA